MVLRIEFGFYPKPMNIDAGDIRIKPIDDYEKNISELNESDLIERDWIYAPLQGESVFGSGEIREKPYSSRVFGLPKTHFIEHSKATDEDHLRFHLWSLSFFHGIRLTSEEAGFLDATPIKPRSLNDFVLTDTSDTEIISLAEKYWHMHERNRKQIHRIGAAVHALFMAQFPNALQFERFIYYYTALDACYKLTATLKNSKKSVPHNERIKWTCQQFDMPVPVWATPNKSKSTVSVIRNDALHEALFMNAPLGFALLDTEDNKHLPHQMRALICRLLVAILGGDKSDYVKKPVDDRQMQGLKL